MHDSRQLQFERLMFFSDAVFAIAITLLVIEIRVPHGVTTDLQLRQGLFDLLPKYIGFVISFFVIGRFWIGHHRVFGYLKSWSPGLLRRNLSFLLAIAFMPFPTAVLGEYPTAPTSLYLYAGWLIAAGLLNLILIHHATSHPELLVAPLSPAQRHDMRASFLPLAIGVAAALAVPFSPLIALGVLTISPFVFNLLLWQLGRKYHDAEGVTLH